MSDTMKHSNNLIISIVFMAACFFSKGAIGQQIRLGAQVGALGASESSGLGYGAFLGVVPYDQIGFLVDATFGDTSGQFYFSSSPSLVFYASNIEELKLGILGGGGFYKFESQSLKFGLNAGATLDFLLAPNLWVGSQVRYHSVFNADQSNPVWNVFLNVSYTFESSDGGW